MAVDSFVYGFQIGDGGLAAGAPVDHVLAAIDEALFLQAHEGFADGARQAGVHREALARPIEAGAFAPDLAIDAGRRILLSTPRRGARILRGRAACRVDSFAGKLRSTTIWVAMPA